MLKKNVRLHPVSLNWNEKQIVFNDTINADSLSIKGR